MLDKILLKKISGRLQSTIPDAIVKIEHPSSKGKPMSSPLPVRLSRKSYDEKIASQKFDLTAPGKKMEKLVIKRFDPNNILPGSPKPEKIKLAGVK